MARHLIPSVGVLLLIVFGIYAVTDRAGAAQADAVKPIRFQAHKLADGFDASAAGLISADIDGDRKPEVIAWSATGIRVFKNGVATPVDCGLGGVRDVISIAAGDFNNDGLPDLAILTESGAQLWANRKGKFEKLNVVIPEGEYNKAIWVDYDHDADLDLLLLGDKSALMRNDGTAGFINVSNNFPFVQGRAVDGVLFALTSDKNGMDLAVIYSDRPGVLYLDELGGRYEAQELNIIPAKAKSILAADLDHDGATDLFVDTESGYWLLFNRRGSFEKGVSLTKVTAAFALVDLENRGLKDVVGASSIFRNEGHGKFTKLKTTVPAASALLALDYDGDGRNDLIAIQPDGNLVFLRNETKI